MNSSRVHTDQNDSNDDVYWRYVSSDFHKMLSFVSTIPKMHSSGGLKWWWCSLFRTPFLWLSQIVLFWANHLSSCWMEWWWCQSKAFLPLIFPKCLLCELRNDVYLLKAFFKNKFPKNALFMSCNMMTVAPGTYSPTMKGVTWNMKQWLHTRTGFTWPKWGRGTLLEEQRPQNIWRMKTYCGIKITVSTN